MYKFGVFLLEMMVNRRPQEEFERGEAGFIEYIRMHYPGNLEQLIDQKMELTQNTFDQAKQAICLGLMCTDVSSHRQPSLEQVFDIVSRTYQSCRVLASHHNHYHRRFQRGKGHRRVQSRWPFNSQRGVHHLLTVQFRCCCCCFFFCSSSLVNRKCFLLFINMCLYVNLLKSALVITTYLTSFTILIYSLTHSIAIQDNKKSRIYSG